MTDILIKVEVAREQLGLNRQKMAELIKSGKLVTFPNPLDKRSKLVKQIDVNQLQSEGVGSSGGKHELFLKITHSGKRKRGIYHKHPRVEQVIRNMAEGYVRGELVRFDFGDLSEHILDGDEVDLIYTKTIQRSEGGTLGTLLDDLSWPPPKYDQTASSLSLRFWVYYGPDGTPEELEWA